MQPPTAPDRSLRAHARSAESTPRRAGREAGSARGLLAAVQFLTRIPVPNAKYSLATAFVWFPTVGLLIGGLLALADSGLHWLQVSSLLASTILVVLLLAVTGALHADGLMDTCDAVFSHASPERRLDIMRDPRVGAFGVVGLVCVVALKIAALGSLAGIWRTALLWLAPGLGRWSIVLLATVFPYGRAVGLGAPLKAAATPRNLAMASAPALAACLVMGPIGIVSGVLAGVSALAFGRWLMRMLPGLTGDSYGAACELVETVVWLGGALVVPRLTA